MERSRITDQIALVEEAAAPRQAGGDLVLARIESFRDSLPVVAFSTDDGEARFAAKTIIELSGSDVGTEVVISFEKMCPTRPVILGKLRRPVESDVIAGASDVGLKLLDDDQVTIRCGKASITLTREGKIILRGEYISSRSTGVNRIKGGSVQIN